MVTKEKKFENCKNKNSIDTFCTCTSLIIRMITDVSNFYKKNIRYLGLNLISYESSGNNRKRSDILPRASGKILKSS